MSLLFGTRRRTANAAAVPGNVLFPLPSDLPAVAADSVVVRRDLRELTEQEQDRFCDALEKMMENGWAASPNSGVATGESGSEYYRLASELCVSRGMVYWCWSTLSAASGQMHVHRPRVAASVHA